MNEVIRNNKLLNREKTALLIIDIQEKILKVMQSPDEVVSNSIKLINGFQILNIPVFYTEQYPQGLGPTIKQILELLGEKSGIQKLTFSCSGAGDLFTLLKEKKVEQIVVCGIESHVCVQQSVLDLLVNGFQVNVAADATSSRKDKDYQFALQRMEKNGAEITTTEAILFELLNVCGTDEFRLISKLIK